MVEGGRKRMGNIRGDAPVAGGCLHPSRGMEGPASKCDNSSSLCGSSWNTSVKEILRVACSTSANRERDAAVISIQYVYYFRTYQSK